MSLVESDLRSHPAVREAEEFSPLGNLQLILPHGSSHPPSQPRDERVEEVICGLAAPLLAPALHAWNATEICVGCFSYVSEEYCIGVLHRYLRVRVVFPYPFISIL